MNDLKPVGEVAAINGTTIVYWDKSLPVGTKLYAIPSTHRVVSVLGLECAALALENIGYMQDAALIRAIIDNKEST